MVAATPIDPFPTMLAVALGDVERTRLVAAWIFSTFESFYAEFRRLTWLAKTAFEGRDPAAAVANARTRLGLYNATVYALADKARLAYPALTEHYVLWPAVEVAYRARIRDRYEGDLAIAYLHSVMRRVHIGEWRPVDYTFGDLPRHGDMPRGRIRGRRLPLAGRSRRVERVAQGRGPNCPVPRSSSATPHASRSGSTIPSRRIRRQALSGSRWSAAASSATVAPT